MWKFLEKFNRNTQDVKEKELGVNNTSIVPTMKSDITNNSIWCATFKLVWNDFQYGILENNFRVSKSNKTIEDLTTDTLKEDILSSEDYYKVIGKTTLELKEKIEEELIRRFNEKSNILDKIQFSDKSDKSDNILIYTMLKKVFSFKKEFDDLKKGKFGKLKKDIEYFGVDENTEDLKEIAKQIRVLFYNSENDFAVKLETNTKDRIILYRTNSNENFEDIFEKINNKSKNYINYKFSYKDTIKIPNLSFNIFKSYDDIKGKNFIRNRDNELFEINEAMQTIEFELDKIGGKIKSEAVIEMRIGAIMMPEENPRHFNFDDTFYLFLIEEGEEKPYFAARIQDIENFINFSETRTKTEDKHIKNNEDVKEMRETEMISIESIKNDKDLELLTDNIIYKENSTFDPFWDEQAKTLLRAILCYLTYQEKEEKTLKRCKEIVEIGLNDENSKEVLNKMFSINEKAKNYYANIATAPEKTYKSIFNTLEGKLQKFVK